MQEEVPKIPMCIPTFENLEFWGVLQLWNKVWGIKTLSKLGHFQAFENFLKNRDLKLNHIPNLETLNMSLSGQMNGQKSNV